MAEEYTCALCGETFEKGWSDEEAHAETREKFLGFDPEKDCAVICDDCYQAFMAWYSKTAS
jgi:hypothetical protein